MARDPKTLWGWASAVAVVIPAIAAGTVHRTVKALKGESFEQTSNAWRDTITELADEHADTITHSVLGAAAR